MARIDRGTTAGPPRQCAAPPSVTREPVRTYASTTSSTSSGTPSVRATTASTKLVGAAASSRLATSSLMRSAGSGSSRTTVAPESPRDARTYSSPTSDSCGRSAATMARPSIPAAETYWSTSILSGSARCTSSRVSSAPRPARAICRNSTTTPSNASRRNCAPLRSFGSPAGASHSGKTRGKPWSNGELVSVAGWARSQDRSPPAMTPNGARVVRRARPASTSSPR